MTLDRDAHINLKTNRAVRDRLLAKLQARGTTMRAFLGDMMELADSDEDFLDMVEMRRMALGKARSRQVQLERSTFGEVAGLTAVPSEEASCADVALTR
jgi:DNA-binding Xre family transcriptional regulator